MRPLFISSRLLLNLFFFVPFIALYATEIGLDFARLLLAEGLFGILVAVMDLPSGHVADSIGRSTR